MAYRELELPSVSPPPSTWEGRVVLITGASSGIGADAARHLAKLKANVCLVGRDETRLNLVANQIRVDSSPNPYVIVADITQDAMRIVSETTDHFGRLDVLMNNAGILIRDSAETIDLDNYDRLMNTNVRSMITMMKYAIPWLTLSKGNILNVSSISGLRAKPGSLTYCLSKAAVNQFTRCAALDLAPRGIRVNAIAPGAIRTPIFETSGEVSADNAQQFFDKYAKAYPVGRIGEVSDTSRAIEFLTNSESSFLTGIIMRVDGGALAGEITL